MKKKNRIKEAVKFIIGTGIAKNQQEVAKLMGYKNISSFSHILNEKVPVPKNFIDKLCLLNTKLNKEWLINGIGEITASSNQTPTENTSQTASDSTFYKIYKDLIITLKEKELKIEILNSHIILLNEQIGNLKQQLIRSKQEQQKAFINESFSIKQQNHKTQKQTNQTKEKEIN